MSTLIISAFFSYRLPVIFIHILSFSLMIDNMLKDHRVNKDPRFAVVGHFIQNGQIKSFDEIFNYIPKSTVRIEIKTNNDRFTRLMNHPLQFKLIELSKIAKACGIETKLLVNLALLHEEPKKHKPNKKAK